MGLVITAKAELVVRAPLRVSLSYIEQLIARKRAWIERKQNEVAARPQAEAKQFIPGEKYWYLGQEYALAVGEKGCRAIAVHEQIWLPKRMLKNTRRHMLKWYKQEALDVLTDRCAHYARVMQVSPKAVKISSAQRRWGSCGSNGILNFTWRLVMAPIEVLDYVVVHELAHLMHMNHSARFWSCVQSILPDYKERVSWLREHEGLLQI